MKIPFLKDRSPVVPIHGPEIIQNDELLGVNNFQVLDDAALEYARPKNGNYGILFTVFPNGEVRLNGESYVKNFDDSIASVARNIASVTSPWFGEKQTLHVRHNHSPQVEPGRNQASSAVPVWHADSFSFALIHSRDEMATRIASGKVSERTAAAIEKSRCSVDRSRYSIAIEEAIRKGHLKPDVTKPNTAYGYRFNTPHTATANTTNLTIARSLTSVQPNISF